MTCGGLRELERQLHNLPSAKVCNAQNASPALGEGTGKRAAWYRTAAAGFVKRVTFAQQVAHPRGSKSVEAIHSTAQLAAGTHSE